MVWVNSIPEWFPFRQGVDDAVVLSGTAEIYIMIVVEVYQTALDENGWRFDNVTVRIW